MANANNSKGTNPITSFGSPDSSLKTEFINCSSCTDLDMYLTTYTPNYGLSVYIYDDPAFTTW